MKKLTFITLTMTLIAMQNMQAEQQESWEDYFREKGSTVAQAAFSTYRKIAGYNQELINAAKIGHEKRVKKLLVLPGINVNAQDKHGNTALIEAARNGHEEIVKDLMNAGADPFIMNDENSVALTLASYNKHTAIADFIAAKMKEKRTRIPFTEFKRKHGMHRIGK